MTDRRKAPGGIDEQGVLQVGPPWELLIDRQIREAMAEGKFDDLPYRGEPLPAEDDAYAGEWALAFHILRNAGVAPPWIEADKEVRALLARRDAIVAGAGRASPLGRSRARAELERIVIDCNTAIARLNAEAPTDRQRRLALRLEDELARFDDAARA